jgi:phosphoglycerol transferase
MRLPRRDVGYAALTVVASSLAAVWVLHLWSASLGIPFAPSGDGYFVLTQVKGLLENGWVLTNSHLGAPFGQEMYDFAGNREPLHILILKVLGLFSSNPAAIVNFYFLLSFPLVGLAAFVVMRWLGLSAPAAAAMSVIYALTPFHFRHQSFLFAYYTVPLAAYLILAVFSERPLLQGRSRQTALTIGLCVLIALSSFYFAGFTVILVVVAAVITAAASRRTRPLVEAGAIVAAIVATGLLASTPDLIYRAEHGKNAEVGKRSAAESETNSTNFIQLVMPVPEHRVPPLRRLRQRWLNTTPIKGEPTQLGLVAAIGFAWLLFVALVAAAGGPRRLAVEARQRQLAVATAATLLVATTGGVSAFIAYVISPQLRSWTRFSVFIAFFALAALGLLLDAGHRWLRGRGRAVPGAAIAAVLVAICVVAVVDETSPAFTPNYDANAASYHGDEAFAQQIESTLGDGAMVMQLPYVPFPEGNAVGGTAVTGVNLYDQLRPYLHTKTIRWSFGAMRGRSQDWSAALAGAPPERSVPAIAAAGFTGIYVDRTGYPDQGRTLELGLARLVDTPPRVSEDKRFAFYDLRAYRAEQRGRTPVPQLRALAHATLYPVRTVWGDDFSKPQPEVLGASRWTVVGDAHLPLTNPDDHARTAVVSMRLARPGGAPAPVTVSYPDGTSDSVTVPAGGVDVRHVVRFPAGTSEMRFTTAGFPIAVNGDIPIGFVKLERWWVGPPSPSPASP